MQQAPGTVESQSVAVLVNSKAVPKGLSLASLQKGVAAAAGIDTARGDQLAFSAMPFNSGAATAAAKAAAAGTAANQKQAMGALIKEAVVFLIIAIVLFLLWRSAKKARNSPAHPGPGPGRHRRPHPVAVGRAHRPAVGGHGRDLEHQGSGRRQPVHRQPTR